MKNLKRVLFIFGLLALFIGFNMMPESAQAADSTEVVKDTIEDKETVATILFGEKMSMKEFLVFYMVAIFGFLASLVMDVHSSGISLSKFKFNIFFKDNLWRIIISIIFILVAILFSENVLGGKINPWLAFMAGLSIDKIIETFNQRKRRKVEIK